MNPRVKQMWIDALRSGEYAQGMETLRSRNNYCCLGVLSDLHAKETGGQWKKQRGGDFDYLGRDCYLPEEVAEWAGLNDGSNHHPAGVRVKAADGTKLDELNDNGTSFNEIADIIERDL